MNLGVRFGLLGIDITLTRILIRCWLPLLLYLAAIVFVSSLQRPPTPDLAWKHIDKLYHVLEYTILGCLAFRAFHGSLARLRWSPTLVLTVTVCFCIAFGISDEIHQRYVAMREASIADLGADTLGTFLGIALGHLSQRRQIQKKRVVS